MCDEGRGVGPLVNGVRRGVYLDFAAVDCAARQKKVEERYGNLFEMYERITGEDPYKVPMRIYPAIHYTMGGLWVDYNLMSTIPGLFVRRRSELLRSRRESPGRERADAGPRGRLLRAALHGGQLPRDGQRRSRWTRATPRCSARSKRCAPARSTCSRSAARTTPDAFHRELGNVMWDFCGMARNREGPDAGHRADPRHCATDFWRDLQGGRHRRRAEPVAREGGARR